MKCLQQPQILDALIENTAAKLEQIELLYSKNSVINEMFITHINSSAQECIPKVEKSHLYQTWHNDDELKRLHELKDELFRRNNTKELIKTRKKIRLRSIHLRNQYYKSEADKINQFAINRELDKLFSRAKKQETTFKSTTGKCSAEKLLNHFQKHFNLGHINSVIPEELSSNLPSFINDLRNISKEFPINHDIPSIDEIQKHLHKLKTGKASNDVDPEILKKCEHPVVLQVIHKLAENFWSNNELPMAWGNSRLKTLWKGKGSKSDPTKYRGISIGSTVCKLMISIILERIRPWYEAQISDEQNGFRSSRGTTDGIFTIKRIHQISNRKTQPLYLLFVDLTAAFDHIPRDWLFRSIKIRFPDDANLKLFDLLEKLYSHTSLTFHEAMTSFPVSSGVRQGGPESPLLFNLYIDYVMRVYMKKCKQNDNINFFQHKYRINARSVTRAERLRMRNNNEKLSGQSSTPWCGYADDLILFMIDLLSLQEASTLLDQVFNDYGLRINETKTETMILNHCYFDTEYPKSIIEIRGVPLKNATEFRYLGSYINPNEPNTGDIEVNYRIQMALGKFASMSNLLLNHEIHLSSRVKFLNSFVRSRLTYACQNWNLTTAQFDRLDVTYRTLLRRMIRRGFNRVDTEGDFRYKINNVKLHAICRTEDVSCFIRKQQMSYAGHVIRMKNDRGTKQLMFNCDKYHRVGRVTPSLLEQVLSNSNQTIESFINKNMKK